MDNITHTLVGVNVANAFFRKRYGRESVWILAAASNVTDIDAVVHLSGSHTAILMRRTFGHSLFLVPLWAFLLAWAFRRRYPHLNWPVLLGLCLLGIGMHLFFDLINSFGVVLLWPFSDFRPELSIVFIIDLILAGILAAPLLLSVIPVPWWEKVGVKGKDILRLLSRLAVVGAAVYILFCGINRRLAIHALRLATDPQNAGAFVYAFPEPLGPHRWHGIVRTGDTYRVFLIHSLTGRIEERKQVQSMLENPSVEKARATPLAQRLEWFFKAPVWSVDGNIASVYDLRFSSLVLKRERTFEYRFSIDPGGKARYLGT